MFYSVFKVPLLQFSIADFKLSIDTVSQPKISNLKSKTLIEADRSSNVRDALLMETTGLEPVTSCLQSRRSPS